MKNFSKKSLKIFLASIILLILISSLQSDDKKKESTKIAITSWVKLGPIDAPYPVFHNVKNIKGDEFKLKDILKFEQFDVMKIMPIEGETFQWNQSKHLKWTKVESDSDGYVFTSISGNKIPGVSYFISYINAKRWAKVKLGVWSHHLFQVYRDGEKIVEKTSSEKSKDDSTKVEAGKATHDMTLETGKHVLLIKSLKDTENKSRWDLKAEIQLQQPWNESDLAVSISPAHHMNIKHLLDGPKISNASISRMVNWQLYQ